MKIALSMHEQSLLVACLNVVLTDTRNSQVPWQLKGEEPKVITFPWNAPSQLGYELSNLVGLGPTNFLEDEERDDLLNEVWALSEKIAKGGR